MPNLGNSSFARAQKTAQMLILGNSSFATAQKTAQTAA